jgi:hypothetical protein
MSDGTIKPSWLYGSPFQQLYQSMTSLNRSISLAAPRKLLPVKVAAKRLGYGPDYVSRLCRNRELYGVRVDRALFIDEESLRLFEQSRSMRKDVRSNELSRQRRAEAAAARAAARRPLILASLYLLAIVVAGGGALLGVRALRALDNSQNAATEILSAASSSPQSTPAPASPWVLESVQSTSTHQ